MRAIPSPATTWPACCTAAPIIERARFYVRRLNNSELANAESLWLGIKVERRLHDDLAMRQLAEQLTKRFGHSREAAAYERGAFDE